MSEKKGKLFVISIPIGNPDDITLRAINMLSVCDLVVCEEYKEASKLLRHLKLNKELIKYNEHSDFNDLLDITDKLQNGQRLALISDCGTPLLADPGLDLIRACIKNDIELEVVPGVTSIITAIVRSGFSAEEFVFAGFLGRTDSERERKLKELANEKRTVVLLETPYRLKVFLEAAQRVIPDRRAYLGFNLTHSFETHHYGTFKELHEKFKNEKIKAEFVVCFESKNSFYE
jgi:16S rRNA (cytidine1402-2'-O)-methyltransferase